MPKHWCGFSASGRNRVKQIVAFCLIATATAAASFAEGVDITQLPEAPVRVITKNAAGDQVQIGDRIPLNVEIHPEWIKGDAQFKLTVPEGSSKLTELGWYLDPNTLWVAGSIRIIVSPLKPGRLTLPTLVVKSKEQDFVAIARTQPLTVNVIATDKDKAAPAELLDPSAVALPTKFIILAIAILAAAIALGIWLYKKLRKKPALQKITPPLKVEEPEHIVAIKRLETLFQNHPHSSEAAKPIAFGISEILKGFLSARFKVDASEATTAEMLTLLRSIGMGSTELREVSDFFDELDQIKFVKPEHLPSFSADVYQRFRTKSAAIVHRWARQVTPPVAGAAPPRGTR